MDDLTKKGEKRCAKPGCTNAVTADDECFGCGFFICEHCVKYNPMGHGHDVVDHWSSLGDDDDDDDGCEDAEVI